MGIAFSLFLSFGYSQIVPLRNANGLTYDFIDTKTKKIISKYSYDQAAPFSEGMARVNRNGLFGYINTNGDEIIPCKYIHANDFSEGLASVSIGTQEILENYIWVKDEKYGVIDISGKKIIPFEFGKIESFKDGIAKALENNKYQSSRSWGWIDKNGKWIIESKYEIFGDFNALGMAKVGISYDSVGYINKKGVFVVDPIYYHLGDFIDGIALATKKEKNEEGILKWKSGFIDSKGETIIPFTFDQAFDFKDGLARVIKEEKWGYITKSGQVQIPLKYNFISDFSNGYAWVNESGYWGVLNNTGKVINPTIFDFIVNGIAPNCVLVSKNGSWGMYDNFGKEIIPIKYEFITLKDSITFRGVSGAYQDIYDLSGNFLTKKIIDFKIDEYDKDLNDNWSDCSWKQSEDLDYNENYIVKNGYPIDSIFNNIKIIGNKNKKYGIECRNKVFISPVYDSIKNINPSDLIGRNYIYEETKYVVLLSCYLNNKIDLCLIKKSDSETSDCNVETKLIKTKYNAIHNTINSAEYLRVSDNGEFGLDKLVNDQLVNLIPLKYDDICYNKNNNITFFKEKNVWGVLNFITGEIISNPQFNNIKQDLHGDVFAVKKSKKWALLNVQAKITTSFIYDNIRSSPCESLYYFFINGKWGIINRSGNELFRPLITRILVNPNHGNGYNGIYRISRQAFSLASHSSFNWPGHYINQ